MRCVRANCMSVCDSDKRPTRTPWPTRGRTKGNVRGTSLESCAHVRATTQCARANLLIQKHKQIGMLPLAMGRFQANLATSIVDNTELFTRTRRRARGGAAARGELCEAQNRTHTPEATLPWKSNRSPRRGHLNFRADMATCPLWTIQNSPCARAAARAAAPPRVGSSVKLNTYT